MEELLPVGSKVLLNNNIICYIIGYLPSKPNDYKLYDYICARNKKGLVRKKDKLVFEKDYFYICQEDIKDVLFIGYQNDEFDILNKYYLLLIDEVKKARAAEDNLNQEVLEEIYNKVFNDAMRELGD